MTEDGYMDDTTSERLIISTPEDWTKVYNLRTRCDAIMVGAETLRRDNPSLLLRDEATRQRRREAGLRPDIAKVCITRSGNISPTMRFFTEGDADRYVFSRRRLPELEGSAYLFVHEEPITAHMIVDQLERSGIHHLLVEGGPTTLRMFLEEGMADTLRIAVNPQLKVTTRGRAHFGCQIPDHVPCHRENLGGMHVTTYTLHPDTTDEDIRYLQEAIDVSRNCVPCASCYRVGAVIRTLAGATFTGYTHETSPTHHAEQEAIAKALQAGADLKGASIYSSMEPCSKRASEPKSCTQLILEHGFAHVAFALYEPGCFVKCDGASRLRREGIDLRVYPELGHLVEEINSHLNVK